jgi:hypothetical protein
MGDLMNPLTIGTSGGVITGGWCMSLIGIGAGTYPGTDPFVILLASGGIIPPGDTPQKSS